MRTLGNILWHLPFCGFVSAAITLLLGFLLTLTVVAAPVGLGLIEFAKFLFWPFGQAMVSEARLPEEGSIVWRNYSLAIGILYLPLGALLALLTVLQIVALCITIVGIVPALVLARALPTYLYPVGKRCVPVEVVEELDRRHAEDTVERHLGRARTARRHG